MRGASPLHSDSCGVNPFLSQRVHLTRLTSLV
jgi:hypothetical protein